MDGKLGLRWKARAFWGGVLHGVLGYLAGEQATSGCLLYGSGEITDDWLLVCLLTWGRLPMGLVEAWVSSGRDGKKPAYPPNGRTRGEVGAMVRNQFTHPTGGHAVKWACFVDVHVHVCCIEPGSY